MDWFKPIITGGDVSEQYFETLGVCRRETELSFLLSGHSGCPLPPRIFEGHSLLSSSVKSCQRFCKIVKFSRGLPTLTQERRFNINSFLCRRSYTNQAYWKKIWQLWKKRLRWHSPLSFFLSAFMKVQNDTIAEIKGEIQMYNRTIRHIEELTKKNQANLTSRYPWMLNAFGIISEDNKIVFEIWFEGDGNAEEWKGGNRGFKSWSRALRCCWSNCNALTCCTPCMGQKVSGLCGTRTHQVMMLILTKTLQDFRVVSILTKTLQRLLPPG